MEKSELMKQLYEEYRNQFQSHEVVLGEGNLDAKLILVGEAPGKDEVKLSKPFVGAAGKNLSHFLSILGIEREEIYITNAIKYRLFQMNAQTGRKGNRPARKEEIEENQSYLAKEIGIIQPSYIVTLGNVPLKAVTNRKEINIGSVHGTLMQVLINNIEYALFPLYHPASIIYNRELKSVYLDDIEKLKAQI